jgi:hypothetical protein
MLQSEKVDDRAEHERLAARGENNCRLAIEDQTGLLEGDSLPAAVAI